MKHKTATIAAILLLMAGALCAGCTKTTALSVSAHAATKTKTNPGPLSLCCFGQGAIATLKDKHAVYSFYPSDGTNPRLGAVSISTSVKDPGLRWYILVDTFEEAKENNRQYVKTNFMLSATTWCEGNQEPASIESGSDGSATLLECGKPTLLVSNHYIGRKSDMGMAYESLFDQAQAKKKK